MNTSQESKLSILKDRAALLAKSRIFFSDRQILEVDCPALSHGASIDLHIDVMTVSASQDRIGYLHTSAEYGMKRLLALGIGDIYQISHVFRSGEFGPLHNPEFTMVEWYRLSLTLEQLMEESCAFIHLFLGDLPTHCIRYRDALLKYADIDYVNASLESLLDCAKQRGIDLPTNASTWNKDTLLNLLFSFLVEPHLGQGCLDLIYAFPPAQAALAQVKESAGEQIALRFEIYHQGIELANGYQELTDPVEQKKRLEESMQTRMKAGKDPLRIDDHFLSALQKGIPDCCGVAVGFDRLILLRHRKSHLSDILPFPWEIA